MEITNTLTVTSEQITNLEMHSVINILSVLSGQLHLIQIDTNRDDLFKSELNTCRKLSSSCSSKDREELTLSAVKNLKHSVFSVVDGLMTDSDQNLDKESLSGHKDNLMNIFNVFEVRMMEILHRWESPDAWESYKASSFIGDFKKFFYAMEKNSHGRYKIIYNIAEQDEEDYLINFAINSDTMDGKIYLPLILKDVIRDLIANARKYTPLGGEIIIGISQKHRTFTFVVEDNGYGIPEEEIPAVIEYGVRGSNVRDSIRTMGGGFGLTKAYYVVSQLGGRMWIKSELNRGTKITIKIPIPDKVYQKYDRKTE